MINIDLITGDNDAHLPLDSDYTLDTHLRQRNSQDKILDERGKHLLEVCISAQIRILNGRKLGDTPGYLTSHQYNGSSTVDYVICSHTLFPEIPVLKVHQYLGTLSDHCMLSFTILTNKTPQTDNNKPLSLHELRPTFKWDEHSRELYQTALNLPTIQAQIQDTIQEIEHCSDTNSFNSSVTKFNTILTKTA